MPKRGRRRLVAALFGDRGARLFLEKQPTEPRIHHGPTARLGALASLEEFSDFRVWTKMRGLSLTATMQVRGRYRKLAVDVRQAVELYRAGATLTFDGVQDWHPVLSRSLRELCRELGFPTSLCHANVYLSPAFGGVPKHFDAHHVLVVQIIGKKTWTVAKNHQVVHPTDNVVATRPLSASSTREIRGKISPRMPRKSERIEMRPGSALFVPSGYWHATQASEPSLSVTFGFRSLRFGDVVSRTVASRLERLPAWRQMPWGVTGNAAQRKAATARLAALVESLGGDIFRFSAAELLRVLPGD